MLNVLFIQSFAIYALFGILMYYIGTNAPSKLGEEKVFPRQYIWCFVLFGVMSGLRWDVGVDHLSYLQSYRYSLLGNSDYREDFEKGYLVIKHLFSSLRLHYSLFFAFWAVLQIYFITTALKDEKYRDKIVPFMLLLIPLSWHYITWMNGVRQMVVACSFVWATKFIINKDFKKYLLWIVACTFIHQSVWILLPVFLLYQGNRRWNNDIAQLFILFGCFAFGSTPTWISWMNNLSEPLESLGFERYASSLDFNTSSDAIKGFNLGPRMISMIAIYCFAIISHRRASAFFNSSTYELFFKLFLTGACAHLLFFNTSIFMRPVEYFIIFSLPVCGYALVYYKKTKKQGMMALLLFISILYVLTACYTESIVPENMRNSFLYQFCFSHWDIVNNPIVRPH